LFEIFVGEIGIPRKEFLYILQFWEARRILRGYQRRKRDLWSAARWSTYYNMMATVGTEGMKKAGINKPNDLIAFPWDKEPTPSISEDEVAEMQAEMAMLNAQLKEKP